MASNALSLIKQLTEENESLNASCTEFERKCASLNDENERLREQNAIQVVTAIELEKQIEFVRVDTVRKMKERLNEAFNSHSYNCRDCIKSKVERVANELLEGKQ